MKQVSPKWLQQYAALRQSLARIGYISDGSVLDRATLKSSRTGYQWTRKVGRKTVTVALSADQFEEMKQAVQNGRHLRKTIRAMEVLSRQILFATTPDTQRRKKLKPTDLRII
jgi:HJR/Mrr/RecB family endonuclease